MANSLDAEAKAEWGGMGVGGRAGTESCNQCINAVARLFDEVCRPSQLPSKADSGGAEQNPTRL